MSSLKIATWNLCLGFTNKKDRIAEILHKNSVNICCIQETEIPNGFPEDLLNCNGIIQLHLVCQIQTSKIPALLIIWEPLQNTEVA